MQNIQIVFFGSRPLEQALTQFLRSNHSAIEVVAAARKSSTLFPLLERFQPQLLILESADDCPTTANLVQKTRLRFPQVKVLVLAHTVDVVQVRRAINIGVAGYLLVNASFEGLASSIRLVNSGKLTLAAEITQALLAAK